jgi:4-hydroxyacetophenone monooxygenase
VDGQHRSIEPMSTAYERSRDELLEECTTRTWGDPSIERSWCKAADGNVYVLCPWRWSTTGG